MWLKHCKYCIRMRSPMLGKGLTLDQFWTTFGTLLGDFWHRLSLNGCPCRELENHAILGSNLALHVGIGPRGFSRFWGGLALIKNIRIYNAINKRIQCLAARWRIICP